MTVPLLEVRLAEDDVNAALSADVRAALTVHPKNLPSRWRWDAEGSELYERVLRAPEYYFFRVERALLDGAAAEIAAVAPVDSVIELGSGTSEKTCLLFDAYIAAGAPLAHFAPIDVSISALRAAIPQVVDRYPDLAVHGLVADFTRQLPLLAELPGERRLLVFLGGTIGSLSAPDRARFLTDVHGALRPGDFVLLGAGLVTDVSRMVAAYDDSAGCAARFNRNVLHRINREFGAGFDPETFRHLVGWNEAEGRVVSFLEADRDQSVPVPGLGIDAVFEKGERIEIDVAARFSPDGLAAELAAAGLPVQRQWVDPDALHTLVLAQRD